MRDWVYLGPAPCAEPCAQVGDTDYYERARAECRRYIALIREVVGPEPSGARLAIRCEPHDFGSYYEVVCYYDPAIPETVEYAYRCEDEAPEQWHVPEGVLGRCSYCTRPATTVSPRSLKPICSVCSDPVAA